jgi:peptidoglycan/xylan/chitin deacetylase (PgdA/CDA1 family)
MFSKNNYIEIFLFMKIESNKIYAVMYHYIHNNGINGYKFNRLKINEFKSQIRFFKKNFNILNYQDFSEILLTKKIPKKPSVILTFDDGYKDHIENVFYALKKEKLKGFFYPPTNIFANKLLDVNKIQVILATNPDLTKIIDFTKRNLKKDFEKIIKKEKNIFKSRYDNKDTTLIKRLYQYAIPEKKRIKLLNLLFNKIVGEDEKILSKKLYLNKKELINLHNEDMHIGIHGIKHYWLSKISNSKQIEEINGAKKFYKNLNINANSICYPYGAYNKYTLKILKKYKFKFGLTTNSESINSKNIKSIYTINRYDTNDFKIFL